MNFLSASLREPIPFILTLALDPSEAYNLENVAANVRTQLQKLSGVVMKETGIEDALELNEVTRYGKVTHLINEAVIEMECVTSQFITVSVLNFRGLYCRPHTYLCIRWSRISAG